MEQNKFFKWLWRLNGLIIFIAAIALSVLALTEAYNKYSYKPLKQESIVSVADDPKKEEKWKLGQSINITGNNVLILPLISENLKIPIQHRKYERSESYSSQSYSHRRFISKNILFINTLTNKSFWLFKGFDRLLLHTELFHKGHRFPHQKVMALFFKVITKDTNGDHIINFEDRPSLSISNPDGSNYRIVINSYERIISKSLVEDDKVLIVFQNEGVGYSILLQLNTFKILSKHELPKVDTSKL